MKELDIENDEEVDDEDDEEEDLSGIIETVYDFAITRSA